MHISIIYGTRPEFLKLKMLMEKIRLCDNIVLNVIKINQHTNLIEDQDMYDNSIDIDDIVEDRLNNIAINIMKKLPSYISRTTHILAQGDTATCFYSLLVGFQMKKICIHLEAGMRTYDLNNPYPEEGYRQMISRITDIHLCPSDVEKEILLKEKTKGAIHVVGNTILDLVKSYNYETKNNNQVLITLHRRENWDDYDNYLSAIHDLAIRNENIKFYFLMHPNPVLKNKLLSINQNKVVKNLIIIEQVPHKELISMLSQCSYVITDSGGIQEEANFLGKHMYILRKITERSAIPKNKITILSCEDLKNISFDTTYSHSPGYEYGDGNSVDKILDILNY